MTWFVVLNKGTGKLTDLLLVDCIYMVFVKVITPLIIIGLPHLLICLKIKQVAINKFHVVGI